MNDSTPHESATHDHAHEGHKTACRVCQIAVEVFPPEPGEAPPTCESCGAPLIDPASLSTTKFDR
ncbi:MAG: hypothetical protein F2663_03355 [Actinobacteria bacterium]|nr:hypothetical protein [Actinomycetota bacterium]